MDYGRLVSLILFLLGLALWMLLVLRARKQAGRVAEQWGTEASDAWQDGKTRLQYGILLMFCSVQQMFPVPSPWKEILFFGSMYLGLIWGEWDIGTGFKLVADAQDVWQARFHENGNEEPEV